MAPHATGIIWNNVVTGAVIAVLGLATSMLVASSTRNGTHH
ncbi:SPW repeat domain-containing protein [Kutzneria kofuensis]|uniref:SPW repeat-containing protein n=1 Tax=Kutzneria kofuensis TaxID=103725 RepID=A0A7W9NL11_9PSEU|nr:SPW repeat protein [Kutzneria kofuensis]MBB5896570.1 hypothetical protein [Kutzneria kofuensis]